MTALVARLPLWSRDATIVSGCLLWRLKLTGAINLLEANWFQLSFSHKDKSCAREMPSLLCSEILSLDTVTFSVVKTYGELEV